KSATETYNLLTEVYGDQCLSRTQVFKWFKKFMGGRKNVGNDPKLCRPSTAKTPENVEKVARIVRRDRRLSIRAISELTNINKESVRFQQWKIRMERCRDRGGDYKLVH
ncbi:hypothetical protein B7P43_G11025, partial [Cryptotermes secundus]